MATPNDIYNEITRIDNAKQGIAEAIEEKGVQVPAETPIQDFPGKVRQIRQGSETAVEYTPQDLTPEQRAQARTNIGATAPEIFFAIYGVTTAAEVDVAVATGKVVVCDYQGRVYYLSTYIATDSYIRFSSVHSTSSRYLSLRRSNNEWTYSNQTLQNTNERVDTISGNESSTTKYPSCKAVADALGKWGVVSQTITWRGSDAAGYDYTLSNPVMGLIPITDINLFTDAGAVFDENTGYFALGKTTDLSYEEVRKAFVARAPVVVSSLYENSTLRAVFPIGGRQDGATRVFFAAKYIKYLQGLTGYQNIAGTNNGVFYNCFSLEECYVSLYNVAVSTNQIFYGCHRLRKLRIKGLNRSASLVDCKSLEVESVAYVVTNAANTTAITITLHADAYARCVADTTEYTYNGQTYTGIIAYAAARNITIASA